MPTVTLKDVAQHAGVSHQTVSNVLNGHPHIRPATKERVLASIAALDYFPNQAAKALREARITTVCCVFYGHNPEDISDPYRNLVQSAFIAEAQAHGYSITTAFVNDDTGLTTLRQRFLQREFGGAVIVSTILTPDQAQIFQAWKMPVVLFDHALPSTMNVTADYPEGMATLVRHHATQGRRQLALIIPEEDLGSTSIRRREGFLQTCAQIDVEGIVVNGTWSYDSGYRVMQTLWTSDRRPDAVLGGNDRIGAGALRAAHDLGLSVPGDVAVSGFDDFEFAQFTTPSLTTIHIPHGDMARQAVRGLISLIDGTVPESRVFMLSLIVRESA